MPNITPYSHIGAIPYTVHHIPLPPTAGVGMTGQQCQQITALLYFDFLHLVGLDDLDVGHRVGQRFPWIRQRNGVSPACKRSICRK